MDVCVSFFFFYDILIYSESYSAHLSHLELVFQRFIKYQLFTKYSKCRFVVIMIDYLGHVISENEMAIDQNKAAAIIAWPIPSSIKILKGNLGLVL